MNNEIEKIAIEYIEIANKVSWNLRGLLADECESLDLTEYRRCLSFYHINLMTDAMNLYVNHLKEIVDWSPFYFENKVPKHTKALNFLIDNLIQIRDAVKIAERDRGSKSIESLLEKLDQIPKK